MQTATTPLLDKLKQSLDINSSVRCIAEWNQNRYSKITSVTNNGTLEADEYDNELFPLSSIVEPERPTQGILKAWTSNRARVSADTYGYVTDGYADRINGGRYITASVDSKYKYWVSPVEAPSAAPYNITNAQPTVLYTNPTWANKLYVALETTNTKPTAFTIAITTDGTNWSTVSTNPTIASDGTISLYRQANGTWSTTVYRENPLAIRGIRLVATVMDKPYARLQVIEIGARIESDLSQFVVSYNVDNSMSDTSFIAPIGKASSNTGGVELDNIDLRFSNDNATSLYYGILDKNVEFRIDVGINKGTIASPDYEWFRQLTMRSESWNGQSPEGTNVELKDASDYLQSIKPLPFLYMDMTVGEIIWRILDSVGFNDWKYEPIDSDTSMLIPQFWSDGESTVWEVIQDLAEVTQTAIYFDEFGVLQIKTRNIAYNLANTPVWNLDGALNGTKQPDIITLETSNDFEANKVSIVYKPTSLSKTNEAGGLPIMESVWEPEETVALRSSQIIQNFLAADTNFIITPSEAALWPYSGVVQIEGEFIRYDAKYYTYYQANGAIAYAWLTSNDDKVKYDKINPTLAYKNYFNGRMRTSAANRGIWNTTAANHYVDANDWTSKRTRTTNGTVRTWLGGFILNKRSSSVSLTTNKTFIPNSWYVVTKGNSVDSIPYWYGTRMRFPTTGYTYGAAGIAMSVGTNDAGYYAEVVRTAAITATDRSKYTNELVFYVRYSDGSIKRIGPNGGKGVPVAIAEGTWYDLDVHYELQGSNRVFSIALNGVTKMNVTVPSAQATADAMGGRYGLFTRGFTSAEFEYMYASTYAVNDSFDNAGWWNRIKGGYQSNQLDKEWTYTMGQTTRIIKGKKTTYAARFASRMIDDFGPIVHEVREYDIKFSKTPVVHSNIYFSNDSQVICPEYNGNAFGAKFILANISRDNAVVSGEDTLSFGADNAVDQKLLIYGRTFTQDDEKTYTVRDEIGIKRRGEVSVDINSPWIQSEAAAKALGQWILTHWSGGNDEVEVSIFGNPLLQLTDVVSVNYVVRGMTTATHKYFITKISHNYSVGLETNLTLRRMKI